MKTIINSIAIVCAAIIMQHSTAIAQCNIPTTNFTTNGIVKTSVYDPINDLVYFGGDFTAINPFYTQGALLNNGNGQPDVTWPVVVGVVHACIPDGSGGFYIGGSFSTVGGLLRPNIAHITSIGAVDPAWNPNANSTVTALAISGSTLYVGGSFTTIAGVTRNRIAALNTVSGAATTWNPNANSPVYTLAISGSTVYAAGPFTTIGGQARNNLAAINTAGAGTVTAWDPAQDGDVSAIAVSGSTVYVGGTFTYIGTQSRNRIAALNMTNGDATSWDPDADSEVSALAISVTGDTIYAGGWFNTIGVGGQTRTRIAALDATSGVATAWDPTVSGGNINSFIISGSTVYAAGTFTSIGGQTRNRIAALNVTTGAATAWDPNANGPVRAIAISGSNIYAGGIFTTIGGTTRNHIAAVKASTGDITAWNPGANNTVHSLCLSKKLIYVGGDFTSIAGQARNRIAAIDTSTGIATAWDPNSDASVRAIANHPTYLGENVYVGGWFTNIGGQPKNYIAAVDTATGLSTAWFPAGVSAGVNALALSSDGFSLFAGGNFINVGGSTRDYIAEINTTGGNVISKSGLHANGTSVYTLLYTGNLLYVGGAFTSIGGQTRNYIAALNTTTGAATAWNPRPNGAVRGIGISGSTVYVGGEFNRLGPVGSYKYRADLAGIDTIGTGTATSWNPNAGYYVNTIAISGNAVYAGGEFIGMGGNPAFPYFAEFPFDNPVITAQSGNTTICSGTNTSYSVTASKTTGYQWQVSTDAGSTWANATGGIYSTETTATLNLTAATIAENGYQYRCVATGVCTPNDTSGAIVLTVNSSPTVTATATPTTTICSGTSITLTGGGTTSYAWSGGVTDGVGFVPSSTATYTVTGTDGGNNCTSTATVTVYVDAPPAVDAGNNISICPSSSTTLNATGTGTFLWSPSTGLSCTTCANPVANPTGTTSYTVTVTSSCGITAMDSVLVSVTTIPSVDAGTDATLCVGGNTTLSATGSGTYVWSPAAGLNNTTIANPIATPTVPTTYTVTMTVSCGTATDEVIVNVNATPTVNANAAPAATVCAGTSVTLTGGGATSYAWTGGVTNGVGFVPSGNFTYTVTGTDGNNCSNTSAIAITVNSLPATPTITVNGSTFASSSSTGNQWNLGGTPIIGATSQFYNATQNGLYTVCVTNAKGCSSCSAVYNYIVNGIGESNTTNSISVYPNPGNGVFTVQLSDQDESQGLSYPLEIYNSIGKNVYSGSTVNGQSSTIDLSSLSKGMYFIKVQSMNDGNQNMKNIFTEKIIIQ